ncbi:MAG: hypothetical protein QOD39_3549 [Mycobacterium sp.]|nr:hypothetical protein [Mycobacterium sp.]
MRCRRRSTREEPKAVNWTASSLEREVKHSRQVVSTAKLIVTFSAAVAATFVAGTLQVTDSSSPANSTSWDQWAAWLMAAAIVFTIIVVLLPPRHHDGELDKDDLDEAKKYAWCVYRLMIAQLACSLASSVAATVGLLHPKWM